MQAAKDLFVGQGHETIKERGCERECPRPGVRCAEAVGYGDGGYWHDATGIYRLLHRRRAVWLNAVKANLGLERTKCNGCAAKHAAATKPTNHDIGFGNLLKDLDAHAAVAGDHKRIIERVGVDEATLCNKFVLQLSSGAHMPLNQVHRCAVRLAGGDLCRHGLRRHDDFNRNTVGATRPGVSGGGVARTEGDDAAALHILDTEELNESCNAIQHAAHLVRAAALQML